MGGPFCWFYFSFIYFFSNYFYLFFFFCVHQDLKSPNWSPGSSPGSNTGFDVFLSPSLLVLAKSIY